MNVDAMLRRITAKQFRNWEIYYDLEPFGEVRADYRAASICQMIANVNRGKEQKPYKLQDFLLQFEGDQQQPKKQTWQQQQQMLTMIAKAFNAAGGA